MSTLNEMLKLGGVLVGVQSAGKDEAVDEILSHFSDQGHFNKAYKTKVKTAIQEREKTGSTGIGNGGAIPHCRIGKDNEVQLFITVTKTDVEFQSIDGKPVRVVFLVILPKNNSEVHAGALKAIAGLMRNERFFRYLKEAKTTEEVYEIISDYEKIA